MFPLRTKCIGVVSIFSLVFILINPALSEMSISERSLPADTVIKDLFQPGAGLPVGKIHSLRGEAHIYHQDLSVGYRARTGLPLYRGDILQTLAKARVLCRLVDGSRLTLAPQTTLTIVQSNSNSARNSSLSFLNLQQGAIRFEVNANPQAAAFEFKVQAQDAFVLAKDANFIIKASASQTEINTFQKSRLEVTSLAEPEEIHFLSDYQRIIVKPHTLAPSVGAISSQEAEALMAEFRLVPEHIAFASDTISGRISDTTEETPPE